MPANEQRSLTARFMASGRSLRDAECRAAAIVTGCCGIAIIAGYRPGDAERERPMACEPETRPAIRAGHCGTVPAGVDRDRILLHCQLNRTRPDSSGKNDGIPGGRRISPAAPGTAARVHW